MTTTSTDTETQLAAPLDPARKHDFAFLFDVRDGNPNGDPRCRRHATPRPRNHAGPGDRRGGQTEDP
jgi:hypothetical protein